MNNLLNILLNVRTEEYSFIQEILSHTVTSKLRELVIPELVRIQNSSHTFSEEQIRWFTILNKRGCLGAP